MNRDVCGQCDAPTELCRCVPSNPIGDVWRVLVAVVERLSLPAAQAAAIACVAWLLTRPEHRCHVKHYLTGCGVGETTATRVMDYLREHGWARVRKHSDGRVVRLAPSKKLLALVNQASAGDQYHV